jgi:hypothetical protein
MDKEREEVEKHRLETLQKLTGNNAHDGDRTERIPSYLEFKTQYTYGRSRDDLDFNNSKFVHDDTYGRRMVYRSQSASTMPWILRRIRRLVRSDSDSDSDDTTDAGMTRKQNRNNSIDSSANGKGYLARLDPSRAARQTSRRDAGTKVERRDSVVSVQTQLRNAQLSASVQNNKSIDEDITTFRSSPAMTRPPTPVQDDSCDSEPEPAGVPAYTRRFSFEPIDRTSLNEQAQQTPMLAPESGALSVAGSTSQAVDAGAVARTSYQHSTTSNSRPLDGHQRAQGGQVDGTVKKRKIPTTFEEILRDRGIPTALLDDYKRGGNDGSR